MNRLEARAIARIAYKEINDVVEKWSNRIGNDLPIFFHWDGCISVGDEFFHEQELRKQVED